MKIKERLKRIFYWRWWIIPIRVEVSEHLQTHINILYDSIAKNIKDKELLIYRINRLEAEVKALRGAV